MICRLLTCKTCVYLSIPASSARAATCTKIETPYEYHNSSSSVSLSSSAVAVGGCLAAGLFLVAGLPNGNSRRGGGGPASSSGAGVLLVDCTVADEERGGWAEFPRVGRFGAAEALMLNPPSPSSSVSLSEARSGVAAPPSSDSSSCSSALA